jgi:hypothetical protein
VAMELRSSILPTASHPTWDRDSLGKPVSMESVGSPSGNEDPCRGAPGNSDASHT